ncbi:MAG: M23 family metallopeptidase [Chloroflexales bacterium]|nr:M23 family metallopeptidase [Chloroflexales bacterium]
MRVKFRSTHFLLGLCGVCAILALLTSQAAPAQEHTQIEANGAVNAATFVPAAQFPLVWTTVTSTPAPPTFSPPSPSPTALATLPPPTALARSATTEPIAADVPTVPANQPEAALVYVFPVRAGQIDYGPYHHDYPAADIFCPIGSEFVAPTGGVVDFVRREDLWTPETNRPEQRGGIAVAIIGDDGVRYYGSHLSAAAEDIEPGQRVVAGKLLGLTGKSGNARSTPPHLHFGMSHPTTPDDWQTRRGEFAPYPYLNCWRAQTADNPCTLSPAQELAP